MVMRTMRENTKWIMLIATAAFVAWLVLDWVQSGNMAQGAGSNPTVAVVNGQEIRYSEWSQFREQRLGQARQQVEGALSDQRLHRVEEQAWDALITQTLVNQELERLELQATDAEVRQAFRSSPPPDLRNHPAFQTDGQFDYQKYRDFFSNPSVDEQLLMQIEQYYRLQIPRTKLFQMVAGEAVVSEEEAWRWYRDRNETARVRFVSVDATAAIPDSAVQVTDEEIRRHYRAHRDEYERPPVAVLDLVSLSAPPSAADSARARTRADSLRRLVTSGSTSFDQLVQQISEEGATGVRAADLGAIQRDQLIGPLQQAAFSVPVGQISESILSPSGYHLIRVSSRQEDQVTLGQILVPIQLSTEGEDALFDQMDRLEGIALRSDLETAADSLGLSIQNDLRLEKGTDFVPGAGNLGVAVSWAFEAGTQPGALSQFFENAGGHHILELEERLSGGVRPLSEVRSDIRQELVEQAKMEAMRARLEEAARALREGATLEQVAREHGWEVREAGPFTRLEFVPGLGQNTPALGAAFGLEPGQLAGPLAAGQGQVALVELIGRSPANRQAFEDARSRILQQLRRQQQQQHLQRWLQALRQDAEIQDMRDQLSSGTQQPARAS